MDRLKRFLSAAGVDWITGEQFEPRHIEDKVKTRLRADVDFVITVISSAGQSTWLRDEIGDAHAREVWIIALLEKGAGFDQGVLGTLEYITYEGVVDTTFIQLLEGINFIRAEKTRRADPPSAPTSGASNG